jgi:hypothetical protein
METTAQDQREHTQWLVKILQKSGSDKTATAK